MKPARLIASLFLLIASSAIAAPAKSNFSHFFSGNTSGNYTMVSCDYAQSVAEDVMTKFGATNIDVTCTGGIQPYGVSPINLFVDYDAPLLTGTTHTEKVAVESETWNSNCFYDTSLVRALLSAFPNVNATRSNDGCFRADTAYSYEFSVTSGK